MPAFVFAAHDLAHKISLELKHRPCCANCKWRASGWSTRSVYEPFYFAVRRYSLLVRLGRTMSLFRVHEGCASSWLGCCRLRNELVYAPDQHFFCRSHAEFRDNPKPSTQKKHTQASNAILRGYGRTQALNVMDCARTRLRKHGHTCPMVSTHSTS